ncbi:MAG: glycosyl hydrolase [Fimbriimonas sp.]|nr:glycosyl hydrolase [Fimbriimonas sp.]
MIALVALVSMTMPSTYDVLRKGWKDVPLESRARMYWRVFGPAWDKPNIERQLRIVKHAGLGGVMTYFMYPVAVDEPGKWRNQIFGSPEFLETFAFASDEAHKLGLRFGVCGSTGWPFGGSKVSLTQSAQNLRQDRGAAKGGIFRSEHKLGPGDNPLKEVYQDGMETSSPTDGDAIRFVLGPTKMQVKRASVGNDGLVVDHLNRNALLDYLESTVRPMLDRAGGRVESVFSDSLEVYRQNWTHDFPEAFRHLRGYDLIPYLPDLFDDHSPNAPRLKQDLWRTVAELAEERYVKALHDWLHKHGVQLELEPYGTPPLPMTSWKYIDLPTGEQYEWMGFNFSRYVASGAHQQGKHVIGSEAWTWGSVPNRLIDSLSDLKLLSDMHFVSGVNDITGVDFPYSPESAGTPGWLPYYGPVMGEQNPQWAVFPRLVEYLNRCSWMLRQGRPATKVAVYLPVEDLMAQAGTDQFPLDFALRDYFVTGEKTDEFGLEKAMRHRSDLVTTLMDHAISFDGVDFWSIDKQGRAVQEPDGAALQVGDAKYSVMVLPAIESIDVRTYEKLAEACAHGVTLVAVGRLPKKSSGWVDRPRDGDVANLSARLFAPIPGQSSRPFGAGKTYFVQNYKDLSFLANLDVAQARIGVQQGNVAVVRRDVERGEIYFVANPNDKPATLSLAPLPMRKRMETWDPLTGDVRPFDPPNDILNLPARGSILIVTAGDPIAAKPRRMMHLSPNLGHDVALRPIDGWSLSFLGPDAPTSRKLDHPVFWQTLPGCAPFSGLGTYRAEFEWHRSANEKVVLHLTDVQKAAQVLVNGTEAGSVWLPPYQVDVTDLLKAGRNEIEIRVYNSMANRFISLPDEDVTALRTKYGVRFGLPEEKKIMSVPDPSGIGHDPYFTVYLLEPPIRP